MSGYRTWTPGEVITASNVQDYLQDQTVMVFASDAVRSTAVVVPTEGMLSWVEDDNKYQYYNGSAWADLIIPITGGTQGQAYVSNGTATASFQDVKAQFIETTITEKTAAYTAVAADTNTVLNVTGASNVTITIPDVVSAVGDMIQILNNTSATVTLAAGTGITSWAGVGTAGTGVLFLMDTSYTAAGVLKTAANEYRVIGKVVV
jgi:hypothetical protein